MSHRADGTAEFVTVLVPKLELESEVDAIRIPSRRLAVERTLVDSVERETEVGWVTLSCSTTKSSAWENSADESGVGESFVEFRDSFQHAGGGFDLGVVADVAEFDDV